MSPACAVVTMYTTNPSTSELTANTCLTAPLKGIPTGTDEIPRNLSDVNTVTGVVGEIRIATMSYSPASKYSTATASVASIAFPAPTTMTYTSFSSGSNFREPTLFLF